MLLWAFSCLLVGSYAASSEMLDEFDDIGFMPYPPPAPASGGIAGSSCVFSPAGTNLHFDLSPMKQTSHDFTSATAGGYTYRFNVCGNAVKECNSQPAPAAKWRGTKCNNLGDSESMRVSLLDTNDPAKGLKLSFDKGDICKKQTPDGGTEMGSRFITYQIACNWGDEGSLKTIHEISMCEYEALFESKYACPISTTRGMYSSLIMLLVFAFCMYCAAGAAYNYHYNQAKGFDAIPNKAFWEELPGLVRDGVQFSYTHAKTYGGRGYELALEKYEAYRSKASTAARMDYLQSHKVAETLNQAVNDMLLEKPSDPYAWLAARLADSSGSSAVDTCAPCIGDAPRPAPCLGKACTFGQHPPWHPVDALSGQRVTGLKVVNSLTGEKVPFVPRQGNRVMWYTCGPTVYDACHMGHARAYLTMDIMRRILEDYFQYEVFLQVNVTDVDDKIILRARRNKLLEMYKDEKRPLAQVRDDAAGACTAFAAKLQKKLEQLQVPKETGREEDERVELLAQQEHKVATFAATHESVKVLLKDEAATPDALVDAAAEALAESLDAEKGAGVTQHEIFDAHARRYEVEWLEDMKALNIRQPDCLTRVTEYVPQIVSFVEAIVAKGLAYESNGSVYMDIAAFKAAGHHYPKLEPSKGRATEAEMAESEGTHKAMSGEKRSAGDFALWKASKSGEPAWPSPWGGGRPGWHIECSVMASDVMGSNMDVHAGGHDLKFPHHDNELCQSEAFHGCSQWVNHFWHFGHLLIKGLKMSKSLKNFITIRQALEDFSARQLRLLFLLQPWDKRMDFSDQTVGEVKTKEATLKNYFDEVKAVLRDSNWQKAPTIWGEPERKLHASFLGHQAAVHSALCDNFNTPGAMGALLAIASDAFAYLTAQRAGGRFDALLLQSGAVYVTRMLRVFGVITHEELGFPVAQGGGGYEEQVGPVLTALVQFRDKVRTAAKPLGAEAFQTMLSLCDQLRDETLIDLGVRVEDRAEGALWKLDEPEVLRRELQAKQAKQLEDRAIKMLNKLNAKLEALAKAEMAATPPAQVLSLPVHAGKYGPLDAEGKPTTDAAGEPLSKSALKTALALLEKHKKEHEKHLTTLAKTPAYLDELRAEVQTKRAELGALLDEVGTALETALVEQLRAAAAAPID